MKKFMILPLLGILLQSHDQQYETQYVPVLMARVDLLKSITMVPAQTMANTGKIYYKDSTIYIVEKFKGVHVIDNHNPTSPVNTGFITIPGVVDVAMKGTTMYADNAIDLVAIEMSSYPQISESGRVEKVFPELAPPGYGYIPKEYTSSNRPANTVIVEWIQK
jgi:hypothetical protein